MEKVLQDKKLYDFLEQVDKEFTFQAQSGGCDHCGSAGIPGFSCKSSPVFSKSISAATTSVAGRHHIDTVNPALDGFAGRLQQCRILFSIAPSKAT
jgi:hypothetical protein